MICQAADKDGLFYLPPPGTEDKAEHIKGIDYLEIVRGKPDQILRGPAFKLVNTRSERIVAARERFAKIKAKAHAAKLSKSEASEYKQLSWLVGADGEDMDE